MQLTELHIDVLLALIEVLPDRALINFSSTCRAFSQVAGPAVRHRKYIKQYQCLVLGDFWHRNNTRNHPFDLMYKIRHDHSIVGYIKEIEYSPADDDSDDDDEPLTEAQRSIAQECNYFEDEVDNLTFLSQDEMREWKAALEEGNRNVAFVVLMSLCIHATRLTLEGLYGLPIYLNRAVDYLNDEYRRDSGPRDKKNASLEDSQLFPRLTTLWLAHDDSERGMSLAQDFSVLSIPTLDELSLTLLGHDDCDEDWVWRLPPGRTCSARTVNNSACAFSPESLATFIGGLPRLEWLEHHDRFDFSLGEGWQSVEEFTERFHEHAEDLLEQKSMEAFVFQSWAMRVRKRVKTGI